MGRRINRATAMDSPAAETSPKVKAGTLGAALATVLGWLLTLVPVVAEAPAAVQGALVVLLVAAGTYAAGYIKRDPLR